MGNTEFKKLQLEKGFFHMKSKCLIWCLSRFNVTEFCRPLDEPKNMP